MRGRFFCGLQSLDLLLVKQQDFIEREEIRRREILESRWINEHIKKNSTDETMLKAEYENFKAKLGDKECSARHIQLQTEAEAREVVAQLTKGSDFAKLTKEKPRDMSRRGKSRCWLNTT